MGTWDCVGVIRLTLKKSPWMQLVCWNTTNPKAYRTLGHEGFLASNIASIFEFWFRASGVGLRVRGLGFRVGCLRLGTWAEGLRLKVWVFVCLV